MPPKITLSSAANNEAPNVRRYDAITRGDVTALTKASQVMVKVLRHTADKGIRTISVRYNSAKPRDRRKPGNTRNGALLITGKAIGTVTLALPSSFAPVSDRFRRDTTASLITNTTNEGRYSHRIVIKRTNFFACL